MGRILGIDYGERRVGLATSDPMESMALPLRVIDVISEAAVCREIGEYCEHEDVTMVVVGMPINMDGSRGPMAEKADAFAARLASRLKIPVRTWDERLSTSLAERVLLEADMSRRKRKLVRDKLAAQIILQGFLDSRVS